MLEINNVKKNFGKKKVLKGITTSFKYGNIYGVIGSNGAGKSTFFRCLCGLEKYTGSIIYKTKQKNIKNSIAYLPTEPYFYPKITGQEYLEFFSEISREKISKSQIEFIKLFNLPLNTYINSYSTGMRKKISFLAILLLKRPIYILDEPFNGLDLDAVLLFKRVILKLQNNNAMILISSHMINSLTDICDTIQYLDEGVFTNKYFKDTYDKIESDLTKDIEDKVDMFFT